MKKQDKSRELGIRRPKIVSMKHNDCYQDCLFYLSPLWALGLYVGMRARGPRPYEVVIRVWARPVRRGGVSPPDIHVLRARGPRPYDNVRGAMNCATTNAFFVSVKLLF